MVCYEVKNLSFTYAGSDAPAVCNVSLTINKGEFITLCGKSGCGKTTLLRLLKPELAPNGNVSGEILFSNRRLCELSQREKSGKIGFVMQSPENQIVTDKVWHELAFGAESLGMKPAEIRTRVAEMASFFGIQEWFYKNVNELSGGQKQILNLASVMVMQPEVLILDEPTSRLDPIAAQEFLQVLGKINREIGTTIILSEHRTEDAFALSTGVLVMENGRITADGTPEAVGRQLMESGSGMMAAMPAAMRIFAKCKDAAALPVTVCDARRRLEGVKAEQGFKKTDFKKEESKSRLSETAVKLDNIWFRYEKNLPDVLKGTSIDIKKGEFYAILGGNGAGKSTAMSVMSGILTPYRGSVYICGRKINEIEDKYSGLLGVLPQNPQTLFVKKTLHEDLCDMLTDIGLSDSEINSEVKRVSDICELSRLLKRHPYDLSGGEQQRAALAKVLLLKPEILLLDEPTKGMDAEFKNKLARILVSLKKSDVTIVMVSHDIEFCAKYADRCGMFFDGGIVSEGAAREFFADKSFYTTAASRMSRGILDGAVLDEDIIAACGGEAEEQETEEEEKTSAPEHTKEEKAVKAKKPNIAKVIFGGIFILMLVYVHSMVAGKFTDWKNTAVQLAEMLLAAVGLMCLLPQEKPKSLTVTPLKKSKGHSLTAWACVIAVPITVLCGKYLFGDRHYYFISLMIIFETLLFFAAAFEKRRPQARELVVISVLCAIAVLGRTAFYMLQQFKPMAAVVIISAVCFGAETGFLVGAVSAFVSNFFFGQGIWTPWQMLAFGVVGFAAGLVFYRRTVPNRITMSVFGFFTTVVIYGGIMNPASVLMMTGKPTVDAILLAYVMGFPLDVIHGISTAFFLWFAAVPMIEKLERIKIKYGI
ncbi:MAG: ATP-binding cassette domain-containing protein [Clostridia bacterium]|nr:ATP-binding cassette domain-containing protein [Clostridia bacterium]